MGFGKDGRGVIIRENVTITLGALGATTGILSTGGSRVSDNLQEDFRLLKSELLISKQDQTTDEGSLFLYLVNGELTLAEAETPIESIAGPLDRNDRINQEQAERYIKPIGQLMASTDITTSGGPAFMPPIEVKPRWTFSNPEGWDWMIYNASAAPLTAGTVVKIHVVHYGVWVT